MLFAGLFTAKQALINKIWVRFYIFILVKNAWMSYLNMQWKYISHVLSSTLQIKISKTLSFLTEIVSQNLHFSWEKSKNIKIFIMNKWKRCWLSNDKHHQKPSSLSKVCQCSPNVLRVRFRNEQNFQFEHRIWDGIFCPNEIDSQHIPNGMQGVLIFLPDDVASNQFDQFSIEVH